MGFDAIFAGCARSRLANASGQSVTYRAPNADALTLTAVVGQIASDEEGDDEGRKRRQRRAVIMGTDATAEGGGIAEVREDATMDIGDDRWAIEAIEARTSSWTRVRVVRIGRVEASRPNYRGRT